MKPYGFHPEAMAEADAAAQFYEEQQPGLGRRFVDALSDAITRIRRNPQLYRRVSGNMKKCRMLRFPYGVIFRDQEECLEIIAVMHLKRKPGYWKSRV